MCSCIPACVGCACACVCVAGRGQLTGARPDLVVVNSRDLLEGLLPNHDGSQVGGVAGQNQQAENGPQVHQEAAGPALWGLEEEERENEGER